MQPELEVASSDNESASTLGSIGSVDTFEDVAREENLNDLVWVDCDLQDAALDEDGDEIFPDTEFLIQTRGANRDWFRNIDNKLDLVVQLNFFWTIDMCKQMVEATNSYGINYIKKWITLFPSEFLAFLGIITYMGIVSYSSRRAYWQHGIKGCEYIKRVMTRERFQQIVRAWHYEVQSGFSELELKALRKEDLFWAVKRFTTELSDRYEQGWTPGQNIDIDEQCIPWKGRHKCRTYNPKKPVKWHFKVLSLNCCSASGYQSSFYLYQGKAEHRPPDITATAYPALQLLRNPKFHHKGYILYTDNWFTSFQQLDIVSSRGIEMVGTIKGNVQTQRW